MNKILTISIFMAVISLMVSFPGMASPVLAVSNTVIDTIPVGNNPVRVAVNELTERAYVTNQVSNTVSVIDITTNTVIDTILVDDTPVGVAINKLTGIVYVANQASSTVSVIDTTTNTVIDTIPASAPIDIVVNEFTDRAYVTNQTSDTLMVVDTLTNTVIENIPVGSAPYSVALNKSTDRAYVTASFSSFLTVVDTTTNTSIDYIFLGNDFSVAVNEFTDRAYVTNTGTNSVDVIDTTNNTVIDNIPVEDYPIDIALNQFTDRAYVGNSLSDTVSVIDTTTNTVLETISVGDFPTGVAVNLSNDKVYVTEQFSHSVAVIGLESSGKTIESNGTGGGNWIDSSTWVGGVVPTSIDNIIIKNPDIVTVSSSIFIQFSGSITVEEGATLIISGTGLGKTKGGENSEHLTRPTFGASHETLATIVDNGFGFKDKEFTITDNYHTDFPEQTVDIGKINSFSATAYSDKGLKVQEFLFGIPEVGHAHLAELGVEIWYNNNQEITLIQAIQKSDVIDTDTLVATHQKSKCQDSDFEEKCDTTKISMKFLEPLQHKIMAIKAIDHKNRYQITYLNDGVNISGESLNPMKTKLIPSSIRDEGLIEVTQTAKYSPYWISEDGRIFEKNSYDSFKQINQSFERFEDFGNPYTRLHSEFGKIIAYEQNRALQMFNATSIQSELPASFAYVFPETNQRITDEVKLKMSEQEAIAEKFLKEKTVQARW